MDTSTLGASSSFNLCTNDSCISQYPAIVSLTAPYNADSVTCPSGWSLLSALACCYHSGWIEFVRMFIHHIPCLIVSISVCLSYFFPSFWFCLNQLVLCPSEFRFFFHHTYFPLTLWLSFCPFGWSLPSAQVVIMLLASQPTAFCLAWVGFVFYSMLFFRLPVLNLSPFCWSHMYGYA